MPTPSDERHRSSAQMREDAVKIWQAGLDAVNAERLVREQIFCEGGSLVVANDVIPLDQINRLVVVGAGKAGAGMAAGLEQALGDELIDRLKLCGWVNVPEGCERKLKRIALHPARPVGRNEPTESGVEGTRHIMRLVETLKPDDLCICLISGGGSALMPLPVDGITLQDKLAVTRSLSAAGANIEQLNTVRKQLSAIKGGGLLRACRQGRMISLIISDVLGDPLDLIASGPTVRNSTTATDALRVLQWYNARQIGVPDHVVEYLEQAARDESKRKQAAVDRDADAAGVNNGSNNGARNDNDAPDDYPDHVSNYVIGNLATAIDAAGLMAEKLGYSHAMLCATKSEGQAEEIGRHMAVTALTMRSQPGPDCLISGGEPVVRLVDPARRGLGGRNQQLVLAALDYLQKSTPRVSDSAHELPGAGITILSGGTDGEDGPTTAAGAIVDEQVLRAVAAAPHIRPVDYLSRNDAFRFFDQFDALLNTGPTHTNVCDIRVVLVDRIELDVR